MSLIQGKTDATSYISTAATFLVAKLISTRSIIIIFFISL